MSARDLVVCGGGPAGAAIAAIAARAGAKVLVIERERFPRDKVCGEFLSAEGAASLRRLGVLDILDAAGAVRMEGCLLSDRKGRSATAPFPDIPGIGRDAVGISRARMDAALLEAAARAGAEVRERHEAAFPVVENGRVAGVRVRPTGDDGPGEEVRAHVVVAADGRRSTLQRALRPGGGDPLRTEPSSWFGLKVHLDGAPARRDGLVELHLFDGGYAGIGAVEGRRLNLCFMTTVATLRACGGEPERVVRERILANPAARASLEGTRACGPWKSVGPLRFGARCASAAGVMFVGDAAGTVDPFAGEGMSHALVGAEMAAPIALAGAARGGLDETLARQWAATWRATFGRATRRARFYGSLFERPALGGVALGVVRAPGGGRLLSRLVARTRTGLFRRPTP